MSDVSVPERGNPLFDELDLDQLSHDIRLRTGRETRIAVIPPLVKDESGTPSTRVQIPADQRSQPVRAPGDKNGESWLKLIHPVDVLALVDEAFDEAVLSAPPPEATEIEEDDEIPVDIDLGEEAPPAAKPPPPPPPRAAAASGEVETTAAAATEDADVEVEVDLEEEAEDAKGVEEDVDIDVVETSGTIEVDPSLATEAADRQNLRTSDPALFVNFGDDAAAEQEGEEPEKTPPPIPVQATPGEEGAATPAAATPPPLPSGTAASGDISADGVEAADAQSDPEAFEDVETTIVDEDDGIEEIEAEEAEEASAAEAASPPAPPAEGAEAPEPASKPPPVPAGQAGEQPESATSPPPVPPASAEAGPEAAAAAPPPVPKQKTKKKKKFRKPWYEEFFDDDYLRTLPYMTEAVTAKEAAYLAERLQLPEKARILDVGCGYGRHAIELARSGHEVTGLDTSLPLLIKAAEITREAGVEVNFMHQDMREMTFTDEFDGAYCVMTSFGYFDDDTNYDVLQRVYRAIRPGGRFFLEVINRDFILHDLPSRVWWEGDDCRSWTRWSSTSCPAASCPSAPWSSRMGGASITICPFGPTASTSWVGCSTDRASR